VHCPSLVYTRLTIGVQRQVYQLAGRLLYLSYPFPLQIKESRELTSKYDEMKKQGLFLRSSPEFYKTNWIGDTLTGLQAVTSSSKPTFATLLRNPDTGARFYFIRQNDSSVT
jgi:hypothetical protein